MSGLKVFTYGEREVRTIMQDGAPWWVLKDVCDVLGLSDTNKTADRLDDDELTRIKLVSGGQTRSVYAVSEPGLYNVIIRSDKPEAKAFKRWITHDVLPTIRRTGGYLVPHTMPEALRLAADIAEQNQALAQKIEADRPKVAFADAVSASEDCILIGELAKLICQSGVDMGQNRLFAWMRDNGYLMQRGEQKNMPTQQAMDMKLFEIKERTIPTNGGMIRITRTPMVTGKGQQYFIDKLCPMAASREEIAQ